MKEYEIISRAIQYIIANYKQQPDLNEISQFVNLSPFYFQRMFTEWAGVSPKKFVQYISLEHARKLLALNHNISAVSFDTGFSGTSRLHDLFVTIEGMTPGEFRNGGDGLVIRWERYESPFGDIIVADTGKGICYMAFIESVSEGFEELKKKFPSADYIREETLLQSSALAVFHNNPGDLSGVRLHLKGTPFQLKIWEALLKIPAGNLVTYSFLAVSAGSPGAARAVGSAVGDNPVAYLIPCHRVIRSTGIFGEYHWGSIRKTAMIGRESAKVYGEG